MLILRLTKIDGGVAFVNCLRIAYMDVIDHLKEGAMTSIWFGEGGEGVCVKETPEQIMEWMAATVQSCGVMVTEPPPPPKKPRPGPPSKN